MRAARLYLSAQYGPPGQPALQQAVQHRFSMVRGGAIGAQTQGNTLLDMGVANYNWKYLFLRPTIQELVDRYNAKFRPTETTAAEAGPST